MLSFSDVKTSRLFKLCSYNTCWLHAHFLDFMYIFMLINLYVLYSALKNLKKQMRLNRLGLNLKQVA